MKYLLLALLVVCFSSEVFAGPLDHFLNQSVRTVGRTLRNDVGEDAPNPSIIFEEEAPLTINGLNSTACGSGSSLVRENPAQALRDNLAGSGIPFIRKPVDYDAARGLEVHQAFVAQQQEDSVYSFGNELRVEGDNVIFTLSFYRLDPHEQNPTGGDNPFSPNTLFRDSITVPASRFSADQQKLLQCQAEYQAQGGLDDYNTAIQETVGEDTTLPVSGTGASAAN